MCTERKTALDLVRETGLVLDELVVLTQPGPSCPEKDQAIRDQMAKMGRLSDEISVALDVEHKMGPCGGMLQ